MLDSTDKAMHEMACVIHQGRVLRVIERAEGESPSDLVPISLVPSGLGKSQAMTDALQGPA